MGTSGKQLGEKNIFRLCLEMSIPAILGMLVSGLYNMVDRLYISNLIDKPNGNTYALTAITVTNPFTLVALASLLLITTGSTALISLYMGQKRLRKAEWMLGNSFVLIVGGSLLFSAVGLFFQDPILYALGAGENTIQYAKEYFSIICFGTVFLGISFGMSYNIRAEGNSRISMITMAMGAIINIILDPILLGPLNMGIAGSAWGTIIAQAISAAFILWYYFSKKSILKIKPVFFKPNWRMLKDSFYIGISPFLLQLLSAVIAGFYNWLLRQYGDAGNIKLGDTTIAAYGAASSITMLFMMCIYGLNNGIQPIFGYNYGARNYKRVKETFIISTIFATVLLSLGFVLCMLFPSFFINFFPGNEELGEIGNTALRISVAFWPFIALCFISSSYFQSVGNPFRAAFITLCRQLIFLVPLLFLLPVFWGIDGIWWAAPIADLIATIITFFFIRKEFFRLVNMPSLN